MSKFVSGFRPSRDAIPSCIRRGRGKRHAWGALVLVAGWLTASGMASAQTVPVSVNVSGNVATVQVGDPINPLADLTFTFDDATGLSKTSLGVSAKLIDLTDPTLLARLPDPRLVRPDSALPLLVTIEPPLTGGLSFRRTTRV